MKPRHWVCLAILVIGVSVGIGKYFGDLQSETADIQYQNSLEGCDRGNSLREAVTGAIALASHSSRSPEAREEFGELVQALREVPYANHDGTIRCEEAIQAP